LSVPSISGKTIGTNNDDGLQVDIGQLSNASTDAWTLDLWGVQLEAGSVATAFQTATGTIQGELAACQRYYEVGSSVDGWSGYAVNGSTYYLSLPFKVQKRTSSPTMTTTISQNIGSASVISQSEYGFRSSGVASATVNSAYFIFSAWNASAEL
jgi:hypothetical protein